MIAPTTDTVQFLTDFSVTVNVVSTETSTVSQSVPVVTADFTDPGVSISTSPGSVTISGRYESIIPISWSWLDNNRTPQSDKTAPEIGTYEKIVKVDSPPFLTKTCNYTILVDGTPEVFSQIVQLSSYDVIKNQLATALEGAR